MTGLDYRIKKDADRAFEKYAKRRITRRTRRSRSMSCATRT